jgi:membrane-associated phospholipid phosphatase
LGAVEAPAGAGLSVDRRRLVALGTAITGLAAFGLLTANVVAVGASGWDRALFRHLYSGESDWIGGRTPGQSDRVLNGAEPILHRLAEGRVLLLLVVAIVVTLVLMRRARAAAFFTAAVAITAVVSPLKQLVARPSPFPLPHDPSFPSGHATLSMAVAAGVVAVLGPGRWRWVAGALGALLVLAVGVAVIADSGHWPSDVLAGWCLALAWVAVLTAVFGHRIDRSPARDPRLRAQAAPQRRRPPGSVEPT